jgi:hypothetical protein
MFEIESFQKAKVLDVRTLARKDRKPDELPGAQLLLQATLSADALTTFDGALKGQLFRKGEGQLDGMEALELTAFAEHVKRMSWEYQQTGCDVEIDRGLGGRRSNIALGDCLVHRILISPRKGGSVVLQWTVDAPALSDEVRGKLTGLKATEIELTIAGPDPDADPQRSLEPAGAAAGS